MRIVIGAAAAAFVAYLGWALLTLDVADFSALMGEPWVQVVLADFYLGIAVFAALVWAVEGSALQALAWGLATCLLGNPVAALWFVVRGWPRLRARRRDDGGDEAGARTAPGAR